MLYHYFGNKEALFRAMLRQKMTERRSWAAICPATRRNACRSGLRPRAAIAEWIRLLEWEALQDGDKKLIDEKERRAASRRLAATPAPAAKAGTTDICLRSAPSGAGHAIADGISGGLSANDAAAHRQSIDDPRFKVNTGSS